MVGGILTAGEAGEGLDMIQEACGVHRSSTRNIFTNNGEVDKALTVLVKVLLLPRTYHERCCEGVLCSVR